MDGLEYLTPKKEDSNMCGIIGIISKANNGFIKPDMKLFEELLFADQLRGVDGTGLFYNQRKEILNFKVPGNTGELMRTEGYHKQIEDVIARGNFIIGHNRAATKGAHTWENTHPFQEDHITLVHNGTLYYHNNLAKDCNVDSRAIAKHMAAWGYNETLKEIHGAFALAWADELDESLNFCRNNDRPLSIIETHFFWIISSEAELGVWIATRNKHKVIRVIDVEPKTKYSFKFGAFDTLIEEDVDYYTPNVGGTWIRDVMGYSHPSGGNTDREQEDALAEYYRKQENPEEELAKQGEDDHKIIEGLFKSVTDKRTPQQHHIPYKRPFLEDIAFGNKVYFYPIDKPGKKGKKKHRIFQVGIAGDEANPLMYFIKGHPFGDTGIEIKCYGSIKNLSAIQSESVLKGTMVRRYAIGDKQVWILENVEAIHDCKCGRCNKKIASDIDIMWSRQDSKGIVCPTCVDEDIARESKFNVLHKQIGYTKH
jgi:hypothetical protein